MCHEEQPTPLYEKQSQVVEHSDNWQEEKKDVIEENHRQDGGYYQRRGNRGYRGKPYTGDGQYYESGYRGRRGAFRNNEHYHPAEDTNQDAGFERGGFRGRRGGNYEERNYEYNNRGYERGGYRGRRVDGENPFYRNKHSYYPKTEQDEDGFEQVQDRRGRGS